jgi:hypothetical protein
MSASIGKVEYAESDGPAGEQMLEQEGLVVGHAYSVIQTLEVSERTAPGIRKPGGKIFHLVQLCNPWDTYEWKSKWSDKSKPHSTRSLASRLALWMPTMVCFE